MFKNNLHGLAAIMYIPWQDSASLCVKVQTSGCTSPNKFSWMTIVAFRKEGNVIFNDALNTFYLRLYGVRHMVKNHYDSEKGNPLPPHRLLLSINSNGSFICTIPQTG